MRTVLLTALAGDGSSATSLDGPLASTMMVVLGVALVLGRHEIADLMTSWRNRARHRRADRRAARPR
ncbi:hypothetical protein [Candidatus Solirubrobacter pratensis]|uniref:hypothetical protein n=1 Tax=Candidatus Solirubrobacter pratensis TaxID=1298857 RepID=UPI00041694E0|nr:hypothetical protein [Candidatus Solirubrobacter pratensis]